LKGHGFALLPRAALKRFGLLFKITFAVALKGHGSAFRLLPAIALKGRGFSRAATG
jgi:hypothetical protein